ncbi:MAG: UPF0175 family protein [Prevotellaceae bacterium]|jgi:predicted HTH domain antitoxin|nr:UPF0175 family protein [Prevotellaceae bacterium]
MQHLTIPLSDNLLISLNMNSDEVALSMRREYAMKQYREGRLTLSQSAELCGMNIYDFMSLLSQNSIAVIDYSPEELRREVAML